MKNSKKLFLAGIASILMSNNVFATKNPYKYITELNVGTHIENDDLVWLKHTYPNIKTIIVGVDLPPNIIKRIEEVHNITVRIDPEYDPGSYPDQQGWC